MKQLHIYRDLLLRWSGVLNLSSRRLSDERGFDASIEMSLSIVPHLPTNLHRLIDLGSGQGFPAIPLAIATGVAVDLIESDRRKAAFLTTALATLQLRGNVWPCRIEDADVTPADCVTARALAPVVTLLHLGSRLVTPEGCCLFLKGPAAAEEVAAARASHRFDHVIYPIASCRTNLVKITNLR